MFTIIPSIILSNVSRERIKQTTGGLCVAVLNRFQIADQSLRPRDARSRQTRNPNAFRVEHKSSVTRETGTCAVYNTLNKKNLLTLDAICVCVCVCATRADQFGGPQ
jgi:hypothetical protein